MTPTLNRDNTVAVDPDYFWQPMCSCPAGVKVQLLGTAAQETRNRMSDKHTIISIKPLYLARLQAALYLSISESMLDKLVQQGDAPKPRKISSGRTAWLVEELDSWGRARPVSDLLPPVNSGYGRAGKAVSQA